MTVTPEQTEYRVAWKAWSESLPREDMEGDPRELVYKAFQDAWFTGRGAANADLTAALARIETLTGERGTLAAALQSSSTLLEAVVDICTPFGWGAPIAQRILANDDALAAASSTSQGDEGREDDDDGMEPCPNGCLGQWGEGTSGQPVPMYCGQHGCDVESPGMAYKTKHQQPERAESTDA